MVILKVKCDDCGEEFEGKELENITSYCDYHLCIKCEDERAEKCELILGERND